MVTIRITSTVISLALMLAAISACGGGKSAPAEPPPTAVAACEPDNASARMGYQTLRPSVVFVGVEGEEGAGWATGFVVGAGEVLTNAHVVSGAREISLEFAGGRTAQADIAAIRIDTKRDVALVRADTGDAPPVALDDASKLQVGQDLIAVGYPALPGESRLRVAGSAGDPTITSGLFNGHKQLRSDDWLEISVPIHPGNSGGPVSDLCGTVYGIATLYTDFESASFAVPSTDVSTFVTTVHTGGGDSVSVRKNTSDLPGSLEDSFRAANLGVGDFPAGFALVGEQFAGSNAVPGKALRSCTGAIGLLSSFKNEADSLPAGPVIASAESGVFTLPDGDAAASCFTQASQFFASEEYVAAIARSAESPDVRVRVDGTEGLELPHVFEQEAGLLVRGSFLVADGDAVPFETVAFGFRKQSEVGVVVIYFLHGHDFEAVGELAGTLSKRMDVVFQDKRR